MPKAGFVFSPPQRGKNSPPPPPKTMNISRTPGLVVIGRKNYQLFRPLFAQFFFFPRAAKLRISASRFHHWVRFFGRPTTSPLGSFFQIRRPPKAGLGFVSQKRLFLRLISFAFPATKLQFRGTREVLHPEPLSIRVQPPLFASVTRATLFERLPPRSGIRKSLRLPSSHSVS